MGVVSCNAQGLRSVLRAAAVVCLLATAVVVRTAAQADADVPAGDPYRVQPAVDVNPAPDVFETTIVSHPATQDLGNGVTANVWTFNGTVPGPEIRLRVGDTVVVHYRNELPLPSSIHWHGIELNNASDGSALTQNAVPTGGTFLYRFKVPRPGIFWYHPHHRPTNQVFRGLYGSMVVTDAADDTLVGNGVLPGADRTRTLVLSDTTVCKEPGRNDTRTYDPSAPWVEDGSLPEQQPPTPSDLCDRPMDDHGNRIVDAQGRPIPLKAGDIPNIQKGGHFEQPLGGRTNEGQTVLANGRNPGPRGGRPEAPGQVAPDARVLDLPAGQGLRLQAINAATVRHFRLLLTDAAGNRIPLVRVGGEGGLLDNARIEGGIVGGTSGAFAFNTKIERGEILMAPSDRADLVLAVPADAPRGVATLWTLDYARTGITFTFVPTVPVMHLNITAPTSERHTIAEGDALRTHAAVNDPVEALGPPRGLLPDDSGAISPLLDPTTFSPAKPGSANEDIRLTTDGRPMIDNVAGRHDQAGDYRTVPHTATTRYARLGDLLELTVSNTTAAHHAFHLHGFSFQPLAFERTIPPTSLGFHGDYTFDYREFVDTIDIPSGYSLRFRVRLDDRPQMDGVTPGGGLGRWVFHCHFFFHASQGMHAELVVLAPDGNERPFVDADATSVEVEEGAGASTTGTFGDPDGDAVTLAASVGAVTDLGDGRWSWSYDSAQGAVDDDTVYITAVDGRGFVAQTAFRLEVANVAPVVTVVDPPSGSSFAVGSTVEVTASVDDPGPAAGLTCRFDWDDGLGAGPPLAVADGVCRDSRTMAKAGVRTVVVTASDGEGGSGSDTTLIAVYDQSGGFVTGSGTIDSPAGAYAADASATGSATFEFSARYVKAATRPTGSALFDFETASFHFAATGYQWLVVDGRRAQVRGTGAVSGVGGYEFLLTVADGEVRDRLRLKVWEPGSGRIAYDTAAGASDDIDAASPPPIAGGSVVIHG